MTWALIVSYASIKPARPGIMKGGITLIELLLVTAIIAIIGASVSPFLSNFILRNNLETTTDKIIGTIRKAQSYAMDGKDDATWGVCLSGGNLRLYSGSCLSPTRSEDFSVPGRVTISGLNDTTFSKLRGEPSNALSITIGTDIDSQTVTVNAVGGMTIN